MPRSWILLPATVQSLRSADMSSWLELGKGWLFEHVRDAVAVIDLPDGTIRLWNPAAERLFGYRFADVLGTRIEQLVPGILTLAQP